MRGHVRRHGRGWAVVIDLGAHVPCQRCGALPTSLVARREPALTLAALWRRRAPRRRESGTAVLPVAPTRSGCARRCSPESTPPAMSSRRASRSSTAGATDTVGCRRRPYATSHGMLHKAFSEAVKWGRLSRNPADTAEQPRRANPELKVWTSEQLRRSRPRRPALRRLAATRARHAARRGSRVALVRRRPRTCLHDGAPDARVGQYVVETTSPKTDRGARTIALDPTPLATLRPTGVTSWTIDYRSASRGRIPTSCSSAETDDRSTPSGSPRGRANECAAHGSPPSALHDGRHSDATALIRAGVPLKVVSQRIGHSSPTIMMTIYQAALPGDDEHAAPVGEGGSSVRHRRGPQKPVPGWVLAPLLRAPRPIGLPQPKRPWVRLPHPFG